MKSTTRRVALSLYENIKYPAQRIFEHGKGICYFISTENYCSCMRHIRVSPHMYWMSISAALPTIPNKICVPPEKFRFGNVFVCKTAHRMLMAFSGHKSLLLFGLDVWVGVCVDFESSIFKSNKRAS